MRSLLIAIVSTSLLAAGCKSTQQSTAAIKTVAVKPPAAAPVRPATAPAAFKVFHQDGPKFVLTVAEDASDDAIASLIWKLHDAAQDHSFDTLKISQKAVDQRDPNATFNIYRGTKCASERYAAKPPCGASYHAAGSYTTGSYSNPKWDEGELISSDGNQTQLWK